MPKLTRFVLLLCLAVLPSEPSVGAGESLEEFKIKREGPFEFEERPSISRDGDRVEISFTTQALCDVTIAVEDQDGRILRHLASGVLGPKAPAPFQKYQRRQKVVWDGKDDRGHYLDDLRRLSIRVALGLKPVFERTLYWEPKKRPGSGGGMGANTSLNLPVPLLVPAPEGMYVFEGWGVDHLRLFDHEGNYLRTIYPFPAEQLRATKDLDWRTFPQDGLNFPLKVGYTQATFLTSGTTASLNHGASRYGSAATAFAVRNQRIALVHQKLNRLHADGGTGGLPLTGPRVTFPVQLRGSNRSGKEVLEVNPTSAAFSPDGKWLYLTGYVWREGRPSIDLVREGLHGVVRMAFEGDAAPELFAGSMKQGECGTDQAHFSDPMSVDCDSQGRVYVADFTNDRIQVFMPDGKYFKTLKVEKPARVQIHPKSGEIQVHSWLMQNDYTLGKQLGDEWRNASFPAAWSVFGPIENPQRLRGGSIPFAGYSGKFHGANKWGGLEFNAVFDHWRDTPLLWAVSGNSSMNYISGGGMFIGAKESPENWNLHLFSIKDGKPSLEKDFAAEVDRTVRRAKVSTYLRQRLYVNPKNHKLYVGEQVTDLGKSFHEMVEIDPETGACKLFELPFDAEDIAFDMDGLMYLRSLYELARYEPGTWREVPFDYGEERQSIFYSGSIKRSPQVVSCIPLYTGTLWHKGGLWVSPKGHIAVSCYSTKDDMPHIHTRLAESRVGGGSDVKQGEKSVQGAVYVPRFFPGRTYYGQIHVFDKHGHRICEDEAPGIAVIDGLFIDKEDSIYCMAGSTRVIGEKPYFSDFTGTLLKFRSRQGRILSDNGAPVKMTSETQPSRPPDMIGGFQGRSWIVGAEWMYGGVGYAGRAFGCGRMGGLTCACSNTRFTLDYFARSFAPEFDRSKVAVLDSNGNLILRIGQYGNVEDGKPLIAAGGPPQARSIGGDEVGLVYPVYLAADTDRRLFIADPGNARIVSVKLDYHATATMPLNKLDRN